MCVPASLGSPGGHPLEGDSETTRATMAAVSTVHRRPPLRLSLFATLTVSTAGREPDLGSDYL